MISLALTFLIVGLVAGLLGLYGVAGMATQIAWVLFLVGIVLLVVHLARSRACFPRQSDEWPDARCRASLPPSGSGSCSSYVFRTALVGARLRERRSGRAESRRDGEGERRGEGGQKVVTAIRVNVQLRR